MIYAIFRSCCRIAMSAFFRRIDVEGVERVPAEGPILLAPNHANALVDPLVIQAGLERPITVTAKTTLARNPVLAVSMRAFRVVTFERAQDRELGADPARNVQAFAECQRRLRSGAAICIFPEGVSHSEPSLRPFKTGAARIALDWLEQEGDGGPLKIVPVGLYFPQKDRFRSSVAVRFGEPIDVRAWRAENPQGGVRELTAEIERRVRELTLNFERHADSDLFSWAAELLATGGRQPLALGREEGPRLVEQVRLVHRLQAGSESLRRTDAARVHDLERRVTRYRRELKRLGITPAEVYLPIDPGRAAFFVLREMELCVVGLPLALWGALNHFVPYRITGTLARRLSRDQDQFASNAVFASLILFPFFYALQIWAAWAWLPALVAAMYTASLPYTAAFVVLYRDRVGGAWQRARTFVRFLRRPDLQRRWMDEGRAIIAEIQQLAAHLGESPYGVRS